MLRLGTRSVLYGAHAFWLHPWFVAWAWWQLYGFPWDPRLWVAFFVHDLGYVGKRRMDDEEGESHPIWGARLMTALFDWGEGRYTMHVWHRGEAVYLGRWGSFCLRHSRYYCRRLGMDVSRLCVADKLALALTPTWIYVPMVRATGEILEYRSVGKHQMGASWQSPDASDWEWHAGLRGYMSDWVDEQSPESRPTFLETDPDTADRYSL